MIDSRIVTVAAVIGCLIWLSAPSPGADAPLFIDMAERAGLRFTHVNGASGRFYMPEIMGSGGRCSTTTAMATSTCCSCRAGRSIAPHSGGHG